MKIFEKVTLLFNDTTPEGPRNREMAAIFTSTLKAGAIASAFLGGGLIGYSVCFSSSMISSCASMAVGGICVSGGTEVFVMANNAIDLLEIPDDIPAPAQKTCSEEQITVNQVAEQILKDTWFVKPTLKCLTTLTNRVTNLSRCFGCKRTKQI